MVCQTSAFCHGCITTWFKSKNECPGCLAQSPELKNVKDSLQIWGLVQTVRVCCKYKNFGCNEVHPLTEIEDHEEECGSCDFCHDKDKVIIKSNLRHHYSFDCTSYKIECPFCSEKGTRESLYNSHLCIQQYEGYDKKKFEIKENRIVNFE